MSQPFKTLDLAVSTLGRAIVACLGATAINFSTIPIALRPFASGSFALVAIILILGLKK